MNRFFNSTRDSQFQIPYPVRLPLGATGMRKGKHHHLVLPLGRLISHTVARSHIPNCGCLSRTDLVVAYTVVA